MIQPLNLDREPTAAKKPLPLKLLAGSIIIILAGILSGYGWFQYRSTSTPKKLKTMVSGIAAPGESYGIADAKTFPDSAEGELAGGGIDGEGSHHLVREGGESQYVYLTSSIIDLDQFVGRKVKVWGQTFEAQKAGWLMDVGRLEIIQ
jgi:hypothetical protein